MSKKRNQVEELKIKRPERVKLTEEECLKRMADFPKRKAMFIAAIRAGRPELYLPELRAPE